MKLSDLNNGKHSLLLLFMGFIVFPILFVGLVNAVAPIPSPDKALLGYMSPYNPGNAFPLMVSGINLNSQLARDASSYKGGLAHGGGAIKYLCEVMKVRCKRS